jgi:MinD-like ATPase involved in chromosome partitioning or flagellar assembly
MTRLALCSVKGSPGVSTLACVIGAVWPASRRVVIAECDPSGNDLAAHFGLSPLIGMTSLVISGRRSTGTGLDAHAQRLPGGLEVLVGPVNPDAARSLDRELGLVGSSLSSVAADVVIDCGRLDLSAAGQADAMRTSDHVAVIVRPDAAGLAQAHATLAALQISWGSVQPWVVVMGSSPFDAGEIESLLGVPILGTVPLDHAAAAMACGRPGRARAFSRSPLVQAARHIVEELDGHGAPQLMHRARAPRDARADGTRAEGPRELDQQQRSAGLDSRVHRSRTEAGLDSADARHTTVDAQ